MKSCNSKQKDKNAKGEELSLNSRCVMLGMCVRFFDITSKARCCAKKRYAEELKWGLKEFNEIWIDFS